MTEAKISVTKITLRESANIKARLGYTRVFSTNTVGISISRGMSRNTLIYFLTCFDYQVTLITIHDIKCFGDFDSIEDKIMKLFSSKTTKEDFYSITDVEMMYALL